MAKPLTPLADEVRAALTAAGLSENAAAQLSAIPRTTLKRRLVVGDFTYGELWSLADILKTTPAKIVARAEKRAA